MAIFNPSFVLAVGVILYALTLVAFAVLRIATGVSIQRLGINSLRRISYTLRDGIRVDIRGLGFHLHRPSFAQPTWISLRLTELKITIDPEFLFNSKTVEHEEKVTDAKTKQRFWSQLLKAKDHLKAIHSKIDWLRLVDVEVLNSTCIVTGVGSIQVASITVAVDTRRKTVDRGRLFRHKKSAADDQQPAEWMVVVKSVLFTAEGKDSLEILDLCTLNVHGLLYKQLAGLRDTSISLKLGRIHIPYDDILHCQEAFKDQLDSSVVDSAAENSHEALVQSMSEARGFVSSLLRGIQEIQVAISFIGLTKKVEGITSRDNPLYLNFAMNEFGVDLFRLDQKGPAHRMYFDPKDVAHQALLAAISIGVSIDNGTSKPERLVYVPMATATIKSTLPSKTVATEVQPNTTERNENVLLANLVVTSPSLDIDLKHLSVVLGLVLDKADQPETAKQPKEHNTLWQLLPKASVKLSIQEPVARVVLPAADDKAREAGNYDLLISSTSSISLDLESLHSTTIDKDYTLVSNLRITSHAFYYQTASMETFNLLVLEALDLKTNIATAPKLSVEMSGNLDTFSVHMIRKEISEGLHQIFQQLRKHRASNVERIPQVKQLSFLRRAPAWLQHFQFKGSSLGVEIAGVDANLSESSRGVALRLGSWGVEYRIGRKGHSRKNSSHSSKSGVIISEDHAATDNRRLVFHASALEGYVIEDADKWESAAFLSVPKLEVSASTSRDHRGPVMHINSIVKAVLVQYSLYRYYSILMAYGVVRRALDLERSPSRPNSGGDHVDMATSSAEIVTLDVKSPLIQIKASLPHDPAVMLQVFNIEGGYNRWTSPFVKSKLVRLYAEAPKIKTVWVRIVSVKTLRLDMRLSRRKIGKEFIEESSFDVSTEFIRMAVPHQVVVHKILDNIINTIKATETLNYRARTGEEDVVLRKPPQEAKVVPKISLRSKYLMFELEDSSFEWKLGLIYRLGLAEQKQRLAREEAFRIKVKKMEEQQHKRRDSSRNIPTLANRRGRLRNHSTSADDGKRRTSVSPKQHIERSTERHTDRHMRYDTDGTSGLSGTARISADDAWKKLQQHNATSWKRRINSAAKYQAAAIKDIRHMFWGNDEVPENVEDTETILSLPARPGLMTTLISDLHISLEKPTFPLSDLPNFIHKLGKGMPLDTKYSLLVPMHLQVNMGETRVTLRNYPLAILHIPALRAEQSTRVPSWSLKTNFVIGEEFRDDESMREISVPIIAPEKLDPESKYREGFFMQVRRTASPVKTFSDVDISINSALPTTITWGTSYQPAIQDMMQVIESFTKPQVDPSEKVGFWDKIRLILHARVRIAWKGGGDVHLRLKGSRDPYSVTGHGAGFVMCYRSNVRWDIHQEDNPKKFMAVSCGEYVLAIPDYSHQARESNREATQDNDSVSSRSTHHQNAQFKKVIMKLSGNVRWLAGLVFERNEHDNNRSFEFIPHYNVTLKTPKFAKANEGLPYDAFRGFRSNHIHLSIAVVAPVDRDWSVTNTKPSSGYNSMHLSPRFFTHFYDWWSLFSGVMSLPIRQGKLFPGIEKSNKKFGRHLATIKYNLLLSPFFLSHIYKHKELEDYNSDTVGATGLKIRIDSFMLDLHQRREEFNLPSKGRLKGTKSSGMRINKAQLDFISADVRAVSALIKGTSSEDLKRATDDELASYQNQSFISPDVSRFTIPDNDTLWIDMDDFVELDWILPSETHPETKIMPLAYAPRFTYFRQTDHPTSETSASERRSVFGDEPTHFCVMTEDNDPSRVQRDLILARLKVLQEQKEKFEKALNEHESKLMLTEDNKQDSIREQFEEAKKQYDVTEQKITFMRNMLKKIGRHLRQQYGSHDSTNSYDDGEDEGSMNRPQRQESTFEGIGMAEDFNNRFIIHNIQLKWSNPLRNIILRYAHQVSQRRGFVYYMSRRAVKFLLDILEEQKRNKTHARGDTASHTPSGQSSPSVSFKDPFRGGEDTDNGLEDRISELLKDGKNFVDADDPKQDIKSPLHASGNGPKDEISAEFAALNTYHVRLVAPQIQLQSEKNAKSILLVTAKEMQLKVVQIMDKDRMFDDVSGLVQRRFSADMDGVQFFVASQKNLTKYIKFQVPNHYGAPKGTCWPPWAPIELNFDYQLNPPGWFRVIGKTSASLRYDKYNTLRLKYNDEVSKGESKARNHIDETEHRIDSLWVEFPHIRAICDSVQYYTMYVIVLDLLLYSEPLEKARSEKVEKMLLATDFTDLTGVPEMVTRLQERIRQLDEIKLHFQLHAKSLDRHGWADRLAVERDLASCEYELFIVMKAITSSQRKFDERSQESGKDGLLRWSLSASEIVWHLMRDTNQPLLEIQLQHATYDRTDNSDGSNINVMEIERIHGLNLLPDATYPEMIAPFFDKDATKSPSESESIKMFKVQWHMLEAIAGIPVLDQFEVNLFPLKIQLEREIGKKVFEYVFPDGGRKGKEAESQNSARSSVSREEVNSDDDYEGYTVLSDTAEVDEPTSRSGSLDMRLRPTMTLDYGHKVDETVRNKSRVSLNSDNRRFKLFSGTKRSKSLSRSTTALQSSAHRSSSSRRRSGDSYSSRTTPNGSNTNLSSTAADKATRSKFSLNRSSTTDSSKNDKDEVSQMMARASNYMTLAYAKIPSVVLCLSYKGKGDRNIEDVHDFVFRMPTLEYRNKTWSNLDLALRLKRDVTKALISHTGAIISNKFSHHRPSKLMQSRLREMANNSSLLPNTNNLNNSLSGNTAPTTRHHRGQSREREIAPTTSAFIAGWGQNQSNRRDDSDVTSLNDSMISPSNNTGFATNNSHGLIAESITTNGNHSFISTPSTVSSTSPIDTEGDEVDGLELQQRTNKRFDTDQTVKADTRERSSTITFRMEADDTDTNSTPERSRSRRAFNVGKKLLHSVKGSDPAKSSD